MTGPIPQDAYGPVALGASAYYEQFRDGMVAAGQAPLPEWDRLSGEAAVAWMAAYGAVCTVSALTATAIRLTSEE